MNDIQTSKDKFDWLLKAFEEMARIKTDFDILKFTMDKVWPFIAHQWHFVARQYNLTLWELHRFYKEVEQDTKTIDLYQAYVDDPNHDNHFVDSESRVRWYELEIETLKVQIAQNKLQIIDKKARCERYEEIRLHLEEKNWGIITDEQYQAEEPAYWKWDLSNQARHSIIQAKTWVPRWVLNALDMSSSENSLDPKMRIEWMIDKAWNYDFNNLLTDNTLNKLKQWDTQPSTK